jgi:integrase
MSEVHSTPPATSGKPAKPEKPSPDYPLFAHATGRWAKKVNGRTVYFGTWDNPAAALREYEAFAAGKGGKRKRKPRRVKHDPNKPAKPYPDFPLFAHAAGYWAKKIRGRIVYFGRWADGPQAALDRYEKEKDALHAGRKPREDTGAITIKELVNRFLAEKETRVESGELSRRTWLDYKEACDVITTLGARRLASDLGPDDFAALRPKLAKRWGTYHLGNTIQRIRSVFKWAFESDILVTPIRFGPGFRGASKKTLRLRRAEAGPKLFTAEEIRRMIEAAGVPLKAMILLGINCGFGNSDCANLPLTALDLDGGMIDFPRPKTGIPRRAPLWPETADALRDALSKRPEPHDPAHAGLAFITKYGAPWGKDIPDNPLAKEMAKLLKALDFNGRKRLGFYVLRHTFRTVADEVRDQPATDHVMGHESTHMSSVYRERISDERLRAVVDHVRAWLFQTKPAETEDCKERRQA